ncbi:2-oxoacid:ferredoxin oxidoreductase subunit beta [bacterium]|nr:2-oxoacid:ferredoxin oxidoreductase subunit beta [bacterium]
MIPKTLTLDDFKHTTDPDWCPGCGDFAVLNALKHALVKLDRPPHQVQVVSGIGCSSNLPGFIRSYGFHSIHGRSLPIAMGIKLANPELTVVAAGGDGDGYGIGCGHWIHSCRRNVDFTYIIMDNQIYGLTTGQTSPTSFLDFATKSTPGGNKEAPLNPVGLALMAGAPFVARGFSGEVKHLASLIEAAISHPGFAMVDIFSPCVTYNKVNTYPYFKGRVKKLEEEGHDTKDFKAALAAAQSWSDERIPIGVLYDRPRTTYDSTDPGVQQGPLVGRDLSMDSQQGEEFLKELA